MIVDNFGWGNMKEVCLCLLLTIFKSFSDGKNPERVSCE